MKEKKLYISGFDDAQLLIVFSILNRYCLNK